MKYPVRKSPRLSYYDYSKDSFYFITICTFDKKCLFGSINKINCYGSIAVDAIMDIEKHFSDVKVDKFVVMPNHIHMILVFGCHEKRESKTNLNTVVGLFKSGVSREIHKYEPNLMVWQRSFHDHIIREKSDYEKIWSYIDTNPMRWDKDCFYTE